MKVLILFQEKARHIDLVVELRRRIERTGGHVRAVIWPAGIIADIERGSAGSLATIKGVQKVYDRAIAAPRSGDAHTLAAVAVWNRVAGPPVPLRRRPAGPPPGAPPTDVFVAPDLPRDPAQLREIESEYREHWQALQRNLPPQLQRNLPPQLQRNLSPQPQPLSNLGCHTNGAGYFDTSLYLAGGIAVGVFYVDGIINDNPAGWSKTGSASTASTAQTFADIIASLDQFVGIQPNARLAFTYVNEVDGAGNPLPAPANERTYVNDLRNTHCTDWAVLILVQNGGIWPNAPFHGPSMRLDRTFGDFSYTVRHEFGHIFGAGDQYDPSGPAARYGYLMAAHANACGNDGSGWFPSGVFPSGAGECLDDLMAGWGAKLGYNFVIGPYTAGQFGWIDSDGDGVLDVTRTKPVIKKGSVVCTPGASGVACSGVAFDRPLPNQLSSPYGDVSINSITAVQWRINTARIGAWQDAAPTDGVFDSVSEGFNFTTPELPDGIYTLQIVAINTVGAMTPIPYEDQITITGSSTTNTQPFGSLRVTPERAKFGTPIAASGAGSSDLESGPLEYSWNWGNSGWTNFLSSPNSFGSFTVNQVGLQTVQMRVRDQGTPSKTHLVSRSVTVESYDTPPVAVLTAGPESQHLTPSQNYSLSLNLSRSHDAETPFSALTVEWDTDNCTGPWIAGPKQKTVLLANPNVPKSERRCVRARVTDGAGNTAEARSFVRVFPYNHRPSFAASPVTFAPSGNDYILTVNATDADKSTSWDGMLEYRFDYEGVGIWDTKFDTNPSITLPGAYRDTVAIEVRDRFDGRVRWDARSAGGGGCRPAC